MQRAVKDGRMTCQKRLGEEIPADIGTKALAADRISCLMGLLGCKCDGERNGW